MLTKIRAVIVDDEKAARAVLSNLLERNCPEVTIIESCSNLMDAVDVIKKTKPAVVFLDIQMPRHAGYEIINHFDKIDFEIIFVTAYDKYAIKAFNMNALDYILKPIDRSLLVNAVERISQKIQQQKEVEDYQSLLNSIKERKFNKIVIPELGNRRILNLDDIVAIEAEGAYCKIHLLNGSPLVISKNLKYFQEKLDSEVGFFRSHRAWVINLKYVTSINKTELKVTLQNFMEVKISRTRLDDFEKAIA